MRSTTLGSPGPSVVGLVGRVLVLATVLGACATGTPQDDAGSADGAIDLAEDVVADVPDGIDAGTDMAADTEVDASDGGDASGGPEACPSDGAPVAALSGVGSGAAFGEAVSVGPDTDGDGRADILVGAPGAESAAGRAYLIDGATFTVLRTFEGPSVGARFGASVSLGPDVDDDGRGDVLIGAPHASGEAFDSGAAFLYSGASGLLLASYHGTATADLFGASVSLGPDTDGDGRGDLVVGAPKADDGASLDVGAVVLRRVGQPTPAGRWLGEGEGDGFGTTVSLGPDVDGDGKGDVLVGAPFHDASSTGGVILDAGRAYLFGGTSAALLLTFTGSFGGDRLGTAVCLGPRPTGGLGGDVVLGVPGADPGGRDGAGRVDVMAGDDGSLRASFAGHRAGDGYGSAVALGPRFNLDDPVTSVADLVVGAPGAANGCGDKEAGQIEIINGLRGDVLERFEGSGPFHRVGASVSLGPDLGGGKGGAAVAGAPGAGVRTATGRIFVFDR